MLHLQAKEVIRIKIFRKMHRQVELKIRHALATGKLHHLERHSGIESHSRSGTGKADGSELSQTK
jgi:hypothetical protein